MSTQNKRTKMSTQNKSAKMATRNKSAVSENWQRKKTLTEGLMYALQKKLHCDVTFVVGEDRKLVEAHKLILSVRSTVFSSMMTGLMAEQGNIVIPDIDPETFQQFLQYLYTDDVVIDGSNVTGLLYTSKKYDVSILADRCVTYLDSSMSSNNACLVLGQANVYGEHKLEKKCLKFIWENGEEVLNSDGIKELSHVCFVKVIQADTLQADEQTVFASTLKWSEIACMKQGREVTPENRRQVLGEAIMHVRFPNLSQKYFIKNVSPTNLFSDSEEIKILKYLACPDENVAPFNTNPRKSRIPNELVTIMRMSVEQHQSTGFNFGAQQSTGFHFGAQQSTGFNFGAQQSTGFNFGAQQSTGFHFGAQQQSSNQFSMMLGAHYEYVYRSCSGDVDDRIMFSFNKAISLLGFQLYGNKTGGSYSIRGCLYNCSTDEEVNDSSIDDTFTSSKITYDVKFTRPLRLIKYVTYSLVVNIKGDKSHYGFQGKSTVQNGDLVCSFFTCDKSNWREREQTNVNQGQIPGLIVLI